MTVVDLTIVNVALPTIGRKLHFAESNLQWVVTAYGLTFGGFLLLGGRAADLLGRRRILMLGLALFTAASLGAGLATTDTFLIAMRGLQGFGAAVVLPAALSIVMNMFAEGAERNKALGLWGGIGAGGVPRRRDARRVAIDAAAGLPAAHGGCCERGRVAARRQLLRLHLHRHALYAAGARLLGIADRSRLARGLADVGGARR